MSYEPNLIISHADLMENEDVIRTMAYHPDASEAMKYIKKLLSKTPFEIRKVKLISAQPELSSFNKNVRDLLRDFKIEFAIDY